MEYAVIESGGKQYKVTPGMVLDIDRIVASDGKIVFDHVLMHVSDEDFTLGNPYLSQVVVTASVLENFKGEKIRVAKFLAKSKYRKVTGFRASLSRIKIDKIEKNSAAKSSKSASKKPSKTAESK